MFCFFFQAEDGIRDLVRSRGLGDVYKRQAAVDIAGPRDHPVALRARRAGAHHDEGTPLRVGPVSYTHLTLPTSDLV